MTTGPTFRLAIGPHNVAGQAYNWAEACSNLPGIEAFSFAQSRRRAQKIDGPSHRRAPHHRVRPTLIKDLWLKHLLGGATHFLNESLSTIGGNLRSQHLDRDLPWIRDIGMQVAVLFHGSDIRSPSRHMQSQRPSYFEFMDLETVARFEQSTARRRRLARESGLPLFVSTPDLLKDLPEASWLPVTTQLSRWSTSSPPFGTPRIRALHVPSNPLIKGTAFVDPVLKRLEGEGLVDYVGPGRTPHAQMPQLVQSVDLVIDQILSNSYGVAAIEAMAAGRLVIGSVGRDVRAVVDRPIPIVDCTPDDLEAVIRDIVANPEPYSRIAAEGPAFVARFHSGEMAARVLTNWMQGSEGWCEGREQGSEID